MKRSESLILSDKSQCQRLQCDSTLWNVLYRLSSLVLECLLFVVELAGSLSVRKLDIGFAWIAHWNVILVLFFGERCRCWMKSVDSG